MSQITSQSICHRSIFVLHHGVDLSTSPVVVLYGCRYLRFLIDPVKLSILVINNLTLAKPESDLVLGGFDAVRSVADIPTDILCVLRQLCRMLGWKENVQ